MTTQAYYNITSTIFLIIAALHLARIAYGWDAVIGTVSIPLWVSYIAVALASYLAYRGYTAKAAKVTKTKSRK